MSTIVAILESDPDGTVHLPVPVALRHGKLKVTATLQAVSEPQGTPLDALLELRKLGGLREAIPDPSAWQREQREDRPLPGRE